jgi:hypothetical protein
VKTGEEGVRLACLKVAGDACARERPDRGNKAHNKAQIYAVAMTTALAEEKFGVVRLCSDRPSMRSECARAASACSQ